MSGSIETLLAAMLAEVLSVAKESIRDRGESPAAVAVVIGNGRAVAISMLDFAQRVDVLQKAVTEYGGEGFLILFDGFVSVPAADGTMEQRDALLAVTRTATEDRSSALPYVRSPLHGTVFHEPIEALNVPEEYRLISFG